MRENLAELDPRFVGSGGAGVTDAAGNPVPERRGVGIILECPCGCPDKLYVPFANPIDGGPTREGNVVWKREGDTFETLTLSPSIRRIPHGGSCGWHGFIQGGKIVTCGDSTPPTAEYLAKHKG